MISKLDSDIKYLKGVGPKRAEYYQKIGVSTVADLLCHYPRSYMDFSSPVSINDAVLDENNIIKGRIVKKLAVARIRKGMTIYKAIMTDDESDITIVIYNSEFAFNKLIEGNEYLLYGKVTGNLVRREISSPVILEADTNDKIQPVYPLTEGLTQSLVRTTVHNALKYLDGEIYETVPKDIAARRGLCSLNFALENIHFPKDFLSLSIAKNRLVFDEFLTLGLGMLKLKDRSRGKTGCKMEKASLEEFYDGLPFKLTNAQINAINDCVSDMQRGSPMNRLIQGDVGSGKTAVAAACAFFAYKNGYQTALMAPTEILANQHYKTLSDFLAPFGVSMHLLTGSLTAKKKQEIKESIKSGEVSVIVGTHSLVQESTEFHNLGLVITDEQHRFGVEQRANLSNKGNNPHCMVMSATPIPRTLALMIYGDLDISIINEFPKGRKPVETFAITGKGRERAFGFVAQRLKEGRQAYIVCPMIEENDLELQSVKEYADKISRSYFKEYNIGLLHGKLKPKQKDAIMKEFKEGGIDILVSTTVVEVGVDVPNAAVMVIENSERFGLSQLHQLRGRVGRGSEKSYCILITDNPTEECVKRLKIMSKISDGFKISEEDLKIRGPGDFFGSRQHGLPALKIADMAEDTEILKQAQEEARAIIKNDPTLSKPENKRLAELVDKLFSRNIDLQG